MDDDLDLKDFGQTTRLFPLPRVVLFPHAVLPLHIFEPRYRQMTEDAIATDKLVTIVQLRPPEGGVLNTLGSPPIEQVGCIGRIIQHERLPDGRFNFLLLGRKRVLLRREIPTIKLYRTAEIEILDDLHDEEGESERRSELIGLFRDALERQKRLDPDLASILETSLSLGVLTDLVAHALGLPADSRQFLLAEPRVVHRADALLNILRQLLGGGPDPTRKPRPYPPPFSLN